MQGRNKDTDVETGLVDTGGKVLKFLRHYIEKEIGSSDTKIIYQRFLFFPSHDIDKYFHTLENTALTVPSTNLYPLSCPIFPHALVTTVLHHFHSVKGSLYINCELG